MFLPSWKCNQCQDTGRVHVIGVRKDGVEVDLGIQPCNHCPAGKELADHRRKIKFTDVGMPTDYQRYTFASYDALPAEWRKGKSMARAAAGVFVERRGKPFSVADIYAAQKIAYAGSTGGKRFGLAIYGTYGVGKTGIAATIANELAQAGTPVLFVQTQALLRKVQDSYSDDSQRGYLYEVQQMPVLVLDECNLHNYTDDRREIIAALIDYRNSHTLPYVITCTVNPQDFEKAWGTFVAARVNANCHWIEMAGKVLRDEGQPLRDAGY
jgi:DNA replication protein DnaC